MNGNILILDDGDQTLEIPFAAEVRGSAAAETVQVPARGDVQFGANTGDRVEFARDIGAYDLTAGGNTLTVARPDGGRAEIALNADTELAFADGSTTAGIDTSGGIPTVRVGGQTVSDGFDPSAIALDGADVSGIASPDAGDDSPDDTGGAELAASFSDPSGVFDGVRAELRDSLDAAWELWTDELAIAEDVTIEAEIVGDTTLDDTTLAQASSGTTVNTGLIADGGQTVRQQGVVAEMKTGNDPNGTSPDLRIEIPEVDDWTFNTELSQDVPREQFDALTVLAHEFGHTLGFNGTHSSTVQRSTFDTNVQTDFFGDLVFQGQAAQNANGGEAVTLVDGDPYHLANDDALMGPQLPPGESRDISELELAMLADAGVPVSGQDDGIV